MIGIRKNIAITCSLYRRSNLSVSLIASCARFNAI
jgi:hypothetical protein